MSTASSVLNCWVNFINNHHKENRSHLHDLNTNKIKQSAVKCKWQKKVNSGVSDPWFLFSTFAETKENLINEQDMILNCDF